MRPVKVMLNVAVKVMLNEAGEMGAERGR